MPPLELRPLQTDDLPALMAVQRAAYGDGFMESTEVFARRLASPVNCSLALLLDGALCAYLAAYQSVQGKVTPLHGDFEPPVGSAPDTLYLHDMAVLPGMAGQGLAQRLLQPLWEQATAQGLRHSALVSVQGSQGYWERHGYAVQPLAQPLQQQRLASYGDGAVYMTRLLPPPGHCSGLSLLEPLTARSQSAAQGFDKLNPNGYFKFSAARTSQPSGSG